ncbi:MAG: hypothetical protein BGO54_04065 [Sphingobacteriales bacterium 46-32]|nr:MAG: hypothetical protein BGO54_04065 [Sphingobacteriales bacterium 46-32]
MSERYITARNEIISGYPNNEIIENDPNLYGQYTMVSANLANYLPDIDPYGHMEVFIQLLRHNKLSKLEQANEVALEYLKIEGDDTIFETLKGGAIITTFHTGSYRIINLFLAKKKIPFTLVIGNSIIEQEGSEYISTFRSLFNNNSSNHFRIIDADNALSGLRMLRELKEGRILLLYLDGNSGAGIETASNENRCIIDFLGQQLYARKGIGHLAYTANVPILPIIGYRPSWDEIRLKIDAPIVPDKALSRENFSVAVTQYLYSQASSIIREYPEQWEAWLSLHKVAKVFPQSSSPAIRTSGNIATFNLRHFGLFQIGGESFLLKKSLYQSYVIKSPLFQQLRTSIGQPVSIDDFEVEIWEELIENGVLICVA